MAGSRSGPAKTARKPEKMVKMTPPTSTDSVCWPTPSATAFLSTAFCPKIVWLKTQQKTK